MVARRIEGLTFEDGQPTIHAEVLAGRFGLSVDSMRREMRAGRLTGLVERGEGEDAGRTRLTFRYGGEVWSICVEPDGSACEVDPPEPEPALFRMVRAAQIRQSG